MVTAGRVYYAKSAFVLVLLILQAWTGMAFRKAATYSFCLYALIMNIAPMLTLNAEKTAAVDSKYPQRWAPKLYLLGAVGMVLEQLLLS